MAEPPAKRQRMSNDTYNPVDAENAVRYPTQPNPTTPTRRKSTSYASPTKASLARSHPNVLAKSPGRGLAESRGKLLRAELLKKGLGGASASDAAELTAPPGILEPQVTEKEPDDHSQIPADSVKDGFASAIASALTNAPVEIHPQQENPQIFRRTPPSSRQPQRAFSTLAPRSLADGVVPDLIVPKLVRRSESIPDQLSRSQSGEPELPPTPVQLGLSPAPYRPRGLISSSSGGSRSESGRHRRRVRPGTSAITSSPLKPRNYSQAMPPPSTDVVEPEADIVQEAPESDIEEDLTGVVPAPSQETEVKKAILSDLQRTLDQHKEDVSRLEALTDMVEQNDRIEVNESTTDLLFGENENSITATAPSVNNGDPLPYLDLFAPGNLKLTHTTIPRRIKLRPQMVQKLTLSAPAPWPSDVLQLSFDVLIDTEESRIGSIIQTKPGHYYRYRTLQTWIEKRLEHPFHKHNISGLIWGAGQYFEACIERAMVLKKLSQKYGQEVVYANEAANNGKISPREALVLCHYFDVDEVTFSSKASSGSSNESLPQCILLTYELNLSWTGNITSTVDISITGVNMKAEKGAKALFHKLLAHDNVLGAFDSVWGLLEFGLHWREDYLAGREHMQSQRAGRGITAA